MRAKPECFPRGTSGRAPERSGGAQRPAGVSRSAPAPNSSRREARTPSQVPSLPTARPSLRKRDDEQLPGRSTRRGASAQRLDWRSGPSVRTAFLRRQKGGCDNITRNVELQDSQLFSFRRPGGPPHNPKGIAANGRVYLTFAAERSESEPGIQKLICIQQIVKGSGVPPICPSGDAERAPISPSLRVSARGKK